MKVVICLLRSGKLNMGSSITVIVDNVVARLSHFEVSYSQVVTSWLL